MRPDVMEGGWVRVRRPSSGTCRALIMALTANGNGEGVPGRGFGKEGKLTVWNTATMS